MSPRKLKHDAPNKRVLHVHTWGGTFLEGPPACTWHYGWAPCKGAQQAVVFGKKSVISQIPRAEGVLLRQCRMKHTMQTTSAQRCAGCLRSMSLQRRPGRLLSIQRSQSSDIGHRLQCRRAARIAVRAESSDDTPNTQLVRQLLCKWIISIYDGECKSR